MTRSTGIGGARVGRILAASLLLTLSAGTALPAVHQPFGQVGNQPSTLLPPSRSGDTNQVLPSGRSDPLLLAFSSGNTAGVVNALGEVERVCGAVSNEYRIDCLGDGFKWVARVMPTNPDYRFARREIERAGAQLRRIAKENQDRSKPNLDPGQSSEWRGRKSFTPVQQEKLRTATAAAVEVVREAETRLLRSAESSDRRRTHYKQIATAVGSTRRILRS